MQPPPLREDGWGFYIILPLFYVSIRKILGEDGATVLLW